MHKIVNNRPIKVRCPKCGKFMEAGISRGEHCVEFRHHCVDPGSYIKVCFYAEYRCGRRGGQKSIHWRRSRFKTVQHRRPTPIPLIPQAAVKPELTSAIESVIRDVMLEKLDGVRQVYPLVTQLGCNFSPFEGLTIDMNISAKVTEYTG